MYPSSARCRAQETFQRSRAATTSLINVRRVSEQAAKAWAIEALLAEKREEREEARVARVDQARPIQLQELHDSDLSENPDRGRADPRRAIQPTSLCAG
jgi:hypothetical protein